MVGAAAAAGEYTAGVVSTGSIVVTGNVTVSTNYTSIADAEIVPAAAGLSVSLVNVGVNLALAVAKTKANAYISGSGAGRTLEASAVTVAALGSVKADASVGTPYFTIAYVSVTANFATAVLSAEQNAFIEHISLVAGGDVNVTSRFNLAGEGAEATLGKNKNLFTQVLGDSEAPTISVTLALYSVNANTAVATSDVTSRAFISGAAIQTSGALNVGAEGNAVANANVTTTSSVGYVAVGITNHVCLCQRARLKHTSTARTARISKPVPSM